MTSALEGRVAVNGETDEGNGGFVNVTVTRVVTNPRILRTTYIEGPIDISSPGCGLLVGSSISAKSFGCSAFANMAAIQCG